MIYWERCQTCQKFLETEQEQESGICGRCAIKPQKVFGKSSPYKYINFQIPGNGLSTGCSGVTDFNIPIWNKFKEFMDKC